MSQHIAETRNSCALHGALQLIDAIRGVVPVIHSNAGCGMQHFLGINRQGNNSGPYGSPPVSSSNISEKHVVFGGSSRLREQLKNTVKVVDGELYFIVTGCSTEMVGDDIPAMAKEGREQSFPVIYANTPGFRGDVHHGYQLALKALVEQLPGLEGEKRSKKERRVNVFGILPGQDPFWRGNLEELGRLLEGIGLEVNLLPGEELGVEAWRRVPEASLNIAVSAWGEPAAKLLDERYGTPSLFLEALPVGHAAGNLLRSLAELFRLDAEKSDRFIAAEDTRLRRRLAELSDLYFQAGLQQSFALVGESAAVAGIAEFLTGTLGLLPGLLAVTDPLPEDTSETLMQSLSGYQDEFGAQVVFSEDSARIADAIIESKAGIVLGSEFERPAAEELDAVFLPVSFPLGRKVVIERGYAGYRGASAFLEDLFSARLSGKT
ncbi:MAG: oxalate:formate antiporter [Chlorobiaceae bacterium]|nr:oxalate:formate antiporter [Chlorobiaceae bacterium]